MRLKCVLSEVQRSYIPNIYLWTLNCGDVTIKMDIHRLVAPFRQGDSVEVEISKSLPEFTKGKDFAARGYVITKRSEDGYKILISLWGFLVVVMTKDKKLFDEFEPMDEVYMVIRASKT